MRALAKLPSAIFGGFFGGSLVGLVEAAIIAWSDGGQEYGVFRFAAVAYGIFGALAGLLIGMATVVVPFLARDARRATALSCGLVASLVGLAVALPVIARLCR